MTIDGTEAALSELRHTMRRIGLHMVAAQADAGNFQVVEILELARIADTVPIGVDPGAELLPARIQVVELAVMIAIERLQTLQVGLSTLFVTDE